MVFLWESDLFSLVNPLRKRKEKQTYLLGCNDFKAENAHEEHTHTHIRAYEFSGAFRSRHRRYVCASDHKTLSYFLFFGCIFFNAREREREKSNHLFSTKKEKKRAATFLFFFVRVVLFGLFVGCLFDSRHFFPLPLPHPSSSSSFPSSDSFDEE